MKKNLFLCLSLVFTCLSLNAQNNLSIKPIPDWVDKVQYNYQESDLYKDSVEEGYYYPVQDLQINVAKETYFAHFVRKIISEKGVQNNSEIKIDFDPSFEKLVFHEVKIIRNEKEINKLNLKNIKILNREAQRERFIYNGILSALIILDDIRANDIIEYSFSVVGANPIYEGKYFDFFYLQFYDPTVLVNRSIIVPNSRPLTIKSYSTTYQPLVSVGKTETKYSWNLKKVSGLHVESGIPSWHNPYPCVWISEYKSWEEIVNWGLKLYATSNEKPGRS